MLTFLQRDLIDLFDLNFLTKENHTKHALEKRGKTFLAQMSHI